MKLTKAEKSLLISALEGDKQGSWGDGRDEAIKSLLSKIKREGAN